MFKRKSKTVINREEMGNYIDGFDVYNSLFLDNLLDPTIARTEYTINKFEYRPDLIAQEFYGSTSYTATLMVSTGMGVGEFTLGKVINLIPKTVLDDILSKI